MAVIEWPAFPLVNDLPQLLRLRPCSTGLNQNITAIDRRRFATVKKKRQWNRTAQQSEDDEEEEEEEEDDEEDEGMSTDCRIKEFTMLSRRLDTVVGVALKTSISALGNWIFARPSSGQ
ncbi:hypothetical protein niasHT_031646 [Heterodera trifolii]|uniref:Uncharacterized protein n=1 Tax=Heterodera trifolii TaxID=157864 RepID=A0ABD2J452_9BILA